MTATRHHGFSMPLISDRNQNKSTSVSKNPEDEGAKSSKAAWEKLPSLAISKILKKIGAGDRSKQMYIPNEQDQSAFRKSKWLELSRQYSPERYKQKEPFQGDLDEIVLGCYSHGQNTGRKTVWRKYRQNCDQLTFDTLRVMKKK